MLENFFDRLKPTYEAKKHSGKISKPYKASKGKSVGRGKYNKKVQEVTLGLEDHQAHLVTKLFRNEDDARHSFQVYRTLRYLGFKKIPATYRLVEGKKRVVMSDLRSEDYFLLNNHSTSKNTKPEIKSLNTEALERVLDELLSEMMHSTSDRFTILEIPRADACFWFVYKDGSDLDFSIADYDSMGLVHGGFSEKDRQEAVAYNFCVSLISLQHSLGLVLEFPEFVRVSEIINEFISHLKEKIEAKLQG